MERNTSFSTEIIRYKIDPERHVAFEAAYTEAGLLLQQSPYCLGYKIIKGTEEPENYIVQIQWTSEQDHLNGFRKSSSFGKFFSLVKPYYADIQEMKHYTLIASFDKNE
ncbi:MAG: antibiotic biosynthesis monooxygenase [Bacteroidetes bacterium]|nr:antibiotic biosynthesis monooxygenase [Bacteroidota bacterium]